MDKEMDKPDFEKICGEGLVVRVIPSMWVLWDSLEPKKLFFDARVEVHDGCLSVYDCNGATILDVSVYSVDRREPGCARLAVCSYSGGQYHHRGFLDIMTPEYFNNPDNGDWCSEDVLSAVRECCGFGRRLVWSFGTTLDTHLKEACIELRGNVLILNGKPISVDGLGRGVKLVLKTGDGVVLKYPHGCGSGFAIVKDCSEESYKRLLGNFKRVLAGYTPEPDFEKPMEENSEKPLKPGNFNTEETPRTGVDDLPQPGPLKKFMERARGKNLLFVRSGEGTGENPVTFVGVKLLFDMEGGMYLYSSASDKLLTGVCSIGEDAELSVEHGIEGEVALRWKETGRPGTVNRLFAV